MKHKYYFSVAAMFKNESWSLKEWIEHYKFHGADHIYLVNDFSDDDYLLLIGDPAMIGVACSVASYNNRGKYKVLKYDRRTYTYYPIQIDLNERNSYE